MATTIQIPWTTAPLVRFTINQPQTICGVGLLQGEIIFLVRSASQEGQYHLVRWNYERCRWDCNCPDYYNECRHVKQVSAYSASHPYSATHPNGCPVVVKPPIVAEPKITEIEHQVFYSFNNEKWHCSCSTSCVQHISLVQNRMQKEVEEVKPAYRIVSMGTKHKRRDLLDEITQRAEHKSDILGEINEIKERDMMNAPLTQNRAFSVLR